MPFKRLNGTTQNKTSVETLFIAEFMSLPIFIIASSGMPNSCAKVGRR